ncbi:MAG: ABC transporter permease [Gammaproteobacteria bacterium]|nr:ABC transporter permease [Gammaproteobacteria bacterium]
MNAALSFRPIVAERDVEVISRPSLSYWRDAWIRLKANRRALVSLYIVIALGLFTVVGPWLPFVPNHSAQDLDQISSPPGADRTATIVEPYVPWSGVTVNAPGGQAPLEAPASVSLAGEATTQAVRIFWDPVRGAHGYRIYRNIAHPAPDDALGMPLADVLVPSRVSFEDRLDIKPQEYFYSVVPLDRNGREAPVYATLDVSAIRVITAEEAVKRGLAGSTADLAIGDQVELKLHVLGTDYLGRDMLARLMHGARVSLFIGIVAPFLFILVGILYGSAAGFVGGRVDQVLMRFADFVVALPFLLFMILFRILFKIEGGDSGIAPMLIAMVILSWPAAARLVRGQILQIREEGYISASRLLGAKTPYLVLRHMIPNTMGVILVTITFAVPSAIFTEAFLSFIGMGVAPPTPSWGSMCNEGIKTMLTYPHELIFPALFISITVLAFNLLGDGLRDALDARMRSQE